MNKRTAIILVTYNGWSLTEACLKDLEPLLATDDFVVAIGDNGSTDGTVENIRKNYPAEKYRNLRVYPQKKNLGFGAANNGAIQGLIEDGIDFDTICLLNNDTRFKAEALVKLREELDKTNQWLASCKGKRKEAVLAPTILNVDGSRQNNFFAGLGPKGIGSLQFFLNAFRGEAGAAQILEGTPRQIKDRDIQEVHWASAVCWILSRKVWESAGGFDDKIFMYYEDGDLALRLRKLGARFFISTKSVITHLGGGSARNNLSRALQHDRSQQYVFEKHFGFKGLALSKSFRIARSTLRVLRAGTSILTGHASKEKWEYLSQHVELLKEAL